MWSSRGTRFVVAGALCGVLAVSAMTPLGAQPPTRGGGMGGAGAGLLRGLRDLDLSDDQRREIRAIVAEQRTAGQAGRDQLTAARRALNDAVMAEVVNESTIRALAAQLASLEADAAVQQAHLNASVLARLTPEQRAELREIRSRMAENVGQRRRPR